MSSAPGIRATAREGEQGLGERLVEPAPRGGVGAGVWRGAGFACFSLVVQYITSFQRKIA